MDNAKYKAYLKGHFVDEQQPTYQQLKDMRCVSHLMASVVDHDKYVHIPLYVATSFFPSSSCVRVVSSTRAGMGKTLFINRMAEKLQTLLPTGKNPIITIPLHGPLVTMDSIMECLVNYQNNSECCILHFDISPSVMPCLK